MQRKLKDKQSQLSLVSKWQVKVQEQLSSWQLGMFSFTKACGNKELGMFPILSAVYRQKPWMKTGGTQSVVWFWDLPRDFCFWPMHSEKYQQRLLVEDYRFEFEVPWLCQSIVVVPPSVALQMTGEQLGWCLLRGCGAGKLHGHGHSKSINPCFEVPHPWISCLSRHHVCIAKASTATSLVQHTFNELKRRAQPFGNMWKDQSNDNMNVVNLGQPPIASMLNSR